MTAFRVDSEPLYYPLTAFMEVRYSPPLPNYKGFSMTAPRLAWIDPLSNIIRAREVSPRAILRSALTGDWSQDVLQSLLHEITHHWTFHTIVGGAMALMQAACIRDVPELYPDRRYTMRTLNYMITLNVVEKLLRPVGEGLALFGEFDLTPGSSDVLSTPMKWAVLGTSKGQPLNLLDPNDTSVISERLLNARLHPRSVHTKMRLLGADKSGLEIIYFDGYMMIKRLLVELQARARQFEDVDLFLYYIRSYIFEDAVLVTLLLDEPLEPVARLQGLCARLERRIQELFEVDVSKDVVEFEHARSGPPSDETGPNLAGLRLSAAEQQQGLAAFTALFHEMMDSPTLPDMHRRLLSAQRLSMERRALAYLAMEPAEIQVKNGILMAWPTPRDFEFPAITGGLAEGVVPNLPATAGWISVVFRPVTLDLALLIGHQSQVLKVIPSGGGELKGGEWRDLITHPLCAPPYVEKEYDAYSRWRNSYFELMPPDLRRVVTLARAEVDQCLARIQSSSLRRWLQNAGAAPTPEFIAVQETRSLATLFGDDPKRFENFVVMGLLRGHDVLLPSLHAELLRNGWNSNDAFKDSVEVSRLSGLAIVRNRDGVFEWPI